MQSYSSLPSRTLTLLWREQRYSDAALREDVFGGGGLSVRFHAERFRQSTCLWRILSEHGLKMLSTDMVDQRKGYRSQKLPAYHSPQGYSLTRRDIKMRLTFWQSESATHREKR